MEEQVGGLGNSKELESKLNKKENP